MSNLRELFANVDKRELGMNLLLVFLGFSVAFAGLEIGLRAGLVPYNQDASVEVTFCGGDEQIQSFHPEYGWTLVPEVKYVRQWEIPWGDNQRNVYITNENGFRDTYDSGQEDIVLLGDSFTEGGGVSQNETFAHLLDRWTPNTSIQTYGVGGYGTDQELLIYRNISDQYDHDVVLLGFYLGNDVKNNAGLGWPPGPRRPHFELQSGRLVQVHEPVDEIPPGTAGFRDYGFVGNVHQTLRDTSLAYDWLYSRTRPLLTGSILSQGGSNEYVPPTGENLTRQLRLTQALLEEIATEAEANDANLLIVSIPARGEVTPENPAHYRPELGQPFYDAQREMLQNTAQSNENISLLELKSRLKTSVESGKQVYGQGQANTHFNQRGYRIVAQAMYERLIQSGYISKESETDLERNFTTAYEPC